MQGKSAISAAPDAAILGVLGVPLTQTQFGALVGISQQAVSSMARRGTLRPRGTALEWLQAYCTHLREVGAGRAGQEAGEGSLDLVQERAKLTREQREKVAMVNAKTRGEQADIGLLGEVLALASQAVATRMDALPAAITRACPDLPPPVRKAVETTVFEARREWSRQTAALVAEQLDVEDDDTEGEGT